jgi:phosphoglycolate phosphatase
MKKTGAETKKQIQAIVWDWNGTLLNDVHVCVDSINQMLKPRNIPLLGVGSYREVFGFPVKDYYEKAGFNFVKEPYDVVAIEFIEIYRQRIAQCSLFTEAEAVLRQIAKLNLPQFILSAMQQDLLETSLKEKGIFAYFSFIAGTGDHFAGGKLGSAKNLQQIIGIEPENILLVGDTTHDHEVAEKMGWQSVLISNGHQSANRLKATGSPVLENLTSVSWYLNGHAH